MTTLTKQAVFVQSIVKRNNGRVVVSASNGSEQGPPYVTFDLPTDQNDHCYIGKKYMFTIEEGD